MNKVITILLVLVSMGGLHAQKESDSKSAEKLYDNLGYKKAVDEIQKKPQKESGDKIPAVKLKDALIMADGYRVNGDFENAAKWYAQVVSMSDKPSYKLRYAQALQAVGRYEEAKKLYLEYDALMLQSSLDKGEAQLDFRGKNFARVAGKKDAFANNKTVVVKDAGFNSDKNDFSPVKKGSSILFVSNRKNPYPSSNHTDVWMNDRFFDLWVADADQDFEAKPLKGAVNSKFHEGSATYSGSDRIYFTRNLYNNGKKKKDEKNTIRLGIYSANLIAGRWANVQEMPFNSGSKIHCHPTVSKDGTKMYFASDRQGGFGGLDIYMSEFSKGKWGRPVNLGPQVNSPGHEDFPFIHPDGTLYFSSEGHPGMGGLDLFYATSTTAGDSLIWGDAINMGSPFNSNKDDFGFWAEEDNLKGFFSSNRDGGKGGDDIFAFTMEKPLEKKSVDMIPTQIFAYDEETLQRIPGVMVDFSEKPVGDGDENFVVTLKPIENQQDAYKLEFVKKGNTKAPVDGEIYETDENGKFDYKMLIGNSYHANASKPGYEPASTTFDAELSRQEYGIPMKLVKEKPKSKCLQVEGAVVNGAYNNYPVTGAKVTLINKCSGDEMVITSQEKGLFSFCIECGCDYILKAEKAHLGGDRKEVKLANVPCPTENVRQDLVLKSGTMTELDEKSLTEGSVLELSRVYYDFNQSFIREDAKADLDQLADIMRRNPSMEIELSSHTDSRGNAGYNQDLSERRAKAAADYLSGLGIDPKRIKVVGSGESNPRNECRDGVNCTEEQHQYNRRTEVRVLKFEDATIQIRYKDNKPTKIDRKPRL